MELPLAAERPGRWMLVPSRADEDVLAVVVVHVADADAVPVARADLVRYEFR